jgi:putative redox protein
MPVITTDYTGDMSFSTEMGKHRLVIDVPPGMGGQDRGPTPPELFVASLGSCVAAYVATYCENHNVDTTGLAVDVSYAKVDDPTRLVDVVVTVRLPHAECGARLAAIQRVSEHCPVHETITSLSGITIEVHDCTMINSA